MLLTMSRDHGLMLLGAVVTTTAGLTVCCFSEDLVLLIGKLSVQATKHQMLCRALCQRAKLPKSGSEIR